MSLIQTILNQDFFTSVLIITGILILLRQRHLQPSMALLFFIAGYFATQIPLVSGLLISTSDKYIAQGIISLCLVMVYSSMDANKLLLLATINEVLLIAINIIFSAVVIHPWYHWALFGAINWLSFIALLYNYGNRGRIENRRYTPLPNLVKTWLYIRRGLLHHGKKGSAMEKGK